MAKKKKSKFEITITVDTNDADYQTQVSTISEDDLKKIKPLIKAIKAFKPYTTVVHGSNGYRRTHNNNYSYGECCREDLGEIPSHQFYKFPEEVFEIFENCCPMNEFGFHTVKSVTVSPTIKKQKLL